MTTTNQQTNPTLTRGQANLVANQTGKITAQQKDSLRRDMRQARGRYRQEVIISGIVALVVTIILMIIPFDFIAPILVILIWGVLVMIWYGYAWMQQSPIRKDIDKGIVETATGYIDKSTRQGYHITIADVDYATPPDMYEAFSDTQGYTVYFLPQSKIVVSAEISPEYSDNNDYESDEIL